MKNHSQMFQKELLGTKQKKLRQSWTEKLESVIAIGFRKACPKRTHSNQ